MKAIKLAYWSVVVSLSGCGATRINAKPNTGVYNSAVLEDRECLHIGETDMFFHVPARGGEFIDRRYEYSVSPSGTIMPGTMTSGEYYLGVGVYDWRLTEEGVLRVDTRTGERVMFVRDAGLRFCPGGR